MSIKSEQFPPEFERIFELYDSQDREPKDIAYLVWAATQPFLSKGKIKDGTTWYDVVIECEKILGCTDTAVSPFMSNLPNLVRDLKAGTQTRNEREEKKE